MNAYETAMIWILSCCGFVVIDAFGIPGFNDFTGVYHSLSWLTNPVFTIPGINLNVTGIMALAIAMALATIIVLNSNFVTDRGMAIAIFAVVFWGSFTAAIVVMQKITFPGVEVFYAIFFLISTLIFVIALVQIPAGGMKSHV